MRASPRGDGGEQRAGILDRIAPVELLLDVVGNGGVRADAVALHGIDEIPLGKLGRRVRHALHAVTGDPRILWQQPSHTLTRCLIER